MTHYFFNYVDVEVIQLHSIMESVFLLMFEVYGVFIILWYLYINKSVMFVRFFYDHDAFPNRGALCYIFSIVGKPLPKVVCTMVVL
jgi:hypothetical protein